MSESTLDTREAAEEISTEPNTEDAFAPDGVDLTLIRWMLRRTPTERLEAAQDLIDGTWAFRSRDEA